MAIQFDRSTISTLTPGARQQMKDAAHKPIGSAGDALRELQALESRAKQLETLVNRANSDFQAALARLPEGTVEEMVEPVREAAEVRVSAAETEAREELRLLIERAHSIRRQLETAAEQPSLYDADSSTLDSANRVRPQLESQLAGANLEAIQKRITAAVIRADDAELLALATVLGPILADWRVDGDDPSTNMYALYEAKSALREATARFRDRTLDVALEQADRVDAAVYGIDRGVVKAFTTRTGKDEFDYARKWGLTN